MATQTYTVKKGDVLWTVVNNNKDTIWNNCASDDGKRREIINKYSSPYGHTIDDSAFSEGDIRCMVEYVMGINGLEYYNPPTNTVVLIYPGQSLLLYDTDANGVVQTPTYNLNVPKITTFEQLADKEREYFVTWSCSQKKSGYTFDRYEISLLWKNGSNNQWIYEGGSADVNGVSTTTGVKQTTWKPDDTAQLIRVKVRAVFKKTNTDKETEWYSEWTQKDKYLEEGPPDPPPTPTVSIKDYVLTMELDNLGDGDDTDEPLVQQVQFQVVKNNKTVLSTHTANVTTRHAEAKCNLTKNEAAFYKVRARITKCNDKLTESNWSDYSENITTIPAAPTLSTCKALENLDDKGRVQLTWSSVKGAETYDVEYTTDKKYFDTNSGTTTITGIKETSTTIVDLESGNPYYFRIRAVNDGGESKWSKISNRIAIGETPSSPTTYSSSTAVNVGDQLTLFWIHTPKDESDQTKVVIELTQLDIFGKGSNTNASGVKSVETSYSNINKFPDSEDELSDITFGDTEPTVYPSLSLYGRYHYNTGTDVYKITKTVTTYNDGSKITIYDFARLINPLYNVASDKIKETMTYSLSTSDYPEGAELTWRAKTAGVTGVFSEWSTLRTVNIYAEVVAHLKLSLTSENADTSDPLNWTNEIGDTKPLESFPFYMTAVATDSSGNEPSNQSVIGYHVSITSNATSYTIADSSGVSKTVLRGDEVYSKYFDIKEALIASISASDVTLYNNTEYTITVTISLDSGLTASQSCVFNVAWDGAIYLPDANVYINYDNGVTAEITPYCQNEAGVLVEGVELSVYRREFDGTLTEIATGIINSGTQTIVDPHPALDYARYRVIATTLATGAIRYYDIPGQLVNEKAAIIQWNEEYQSLDIPTGMDSSALVENLYTGSILKLPYNIDVSDKNDADISMVKYIGRKRPVSYYGTQLGETSTWSMSVPKDDKETLYALRRLSIWMGDVYVREPSGSGYWANVVVSFSQKHCDTVIPVTLDITRVEGGM